MSQFDPARPMGKRMSNGLKSGLALAALITGVAGGSTVLIAQNPPTAEAAPVAVQVSAPVTPMAAAIMDARAAALAPARETASGVLKRNSTLIDAVTGLGAESREAYLALQALYDTELIDPRRVRAGLAIDAVFETAEDGARHLAGLTIQPEPERSLIVKRLPEGDYFGAELKTRLTPETRRIEGEVTTSLYEAALTLGAGDQQVVDFAQIFAYDVDFQREIYPGDTFEIVYEAMVDERGNAVRAGEVLYAALDGGATKKSFYRFTPDDDLVTDYFDRNGKSATRFLMKTPINGARLSSHFGNRRHPISGYTRLHKGTDFAAPTGTPVYAAGNGVVERASRYGGYGNYIRIRHANGYQTAYAHLSRYASGVRSGRRVRQGQTIGYVGSTGASTGPHLHYEVIKNGRHTNAMRLKLPTGRTLEGDILDAFDVERRAIDAKRRALGAEVEIASLETDPVSERP